MREQGVKQSVMMSSTEIPRSLAVELSIMKRTIKIVLHSYQSAVFSSLCVASIFE